MAALRVRLTPTELLIADLVGAARRVQSMQRGHAMTYGCQPQNLLNTNLGGAEGEIATAKGLGIYWQAIVGNPDAPDVGPYEVRTNTSQRWDDTLMHPRDKDDRAYIGVLAFPPDFEIMGWIWGWEAKRQEWWRDGEKGRPAFFVPRPALYPISTLPQIEATP